MIDLTCLDLFAGMGMWSVGFYREGYECTGVDIIDVGYPYKLILSDIKNYHAEGSFKVVVASPPCTEYSTLTMLSHKKGQSGPPDPEKGDELVRHAKRIIEEVKPQYWALENVVGSVDHISKILGKPRLVAKPWVLWGNFPDFMFEFEPTRKGENKMSHSFEHKGKGGDVL